MYPPKPSKVTIDRQYHVAVMGDDAYKKPEQSRGRIEFWTNATAAVDKNPVFFRSSLNSTMQLTEKTARALAINLLRLCDQVKEAKKN